MSLTIELRADGADLRATYTNRGDAPLALAFWWNRRMRVVDTSTGREVAPTAGPVLPCGVAEDWTVLAPATSHERAEPLGCTQPAGRSEPIGWTYDLPAGTYRVTLIFEAPAAHGFTQSAPHPDQFRGRVESTEATIVIEPKKKGLVARLFG